MNYGAEPGAVSGAGPGRLALRVSFHVDSVDPVEGGAQVVLTATVECEGAAKPACVAELVLRCLP